MATPLFSRVGLFGKGGDRFRLASFVETSGVAVWDRLRQPLSPSYWSRNIHLRFVAYRLRPLLLCRKRERVFSCGQENQPHKVTGWQRSALRRQICRCYVRQWRFALLRKGCRLFFWRTTIWARYKHAYTYSITQHIQGHKCNYYLDYGKAKETQLRNSVTNKFQPASLIHILMWYYC